MKKLIYLLFWGVFSLSLNGQTVYVDQNAGGANDGSSWGNAYTDLHDALNNTSSGEIWVATGTYVPGVDTSDFFSISSEIGLYGGFAGTEASKEDRDIEANPTILSGDINGDDMMGNFDANRDDNSTQILYVDSLLVGPIVIDGFTVSGAQANLNNGAGGNDPRHLWTGGGIYALSTILVENSHFTMNAARSGGGIGVFGPGAAGSVLSNSTFVNNLSPSQAAGAFFNTTSDVTVEGCEFLDNETNRGALYPTNCQNILIDNCLFQNNDNASGFGGGMFAWQPEDLAITNCIFDGNSASNASGIYIDQRDINAEGNINSVVFDNCTFSNNEASDYGGTGIYFWNSNFTILNSTFEDNFAPSSAPAIYMGGDGDSGVIDNCVFENNTSNFAASVANYNGLSDLLIQNSLFKDNVANSGGGALSGGFLANTTVDNCTFDSNNAGYGGAIFLQNDSTEMTVLNSTFFGNFANTSNGGAIATNSSIPLTVDGCLFEANSALSGLGGALHVIEDSLDLSVFVLRNSFFNFNQAMGQGGALNVIGATTTIENSAFLNNSASDPGTGGAISLNSSEGGESADMQVSIMNSTFADNFGALAEGIASWTDGVATLDITLQNNIFANPGGLDYVVEDGTPTVTSNGGNLTLFEAQPEVFNNAMDILGEDPEFIDIFDYDLQLEETSPCIDAGVAEGAPDTDLLGNPRDDMPDIGAYEYQIDMGTEDYPLFDASQLSLFPNPVRTTATLNMDNDWQGELLVRIVAINGQEMNRLMVDKQSQIQAFPLELGHLQHGAYKVLVSNGATVLATHLVKI
jgi:parallel beta-helix repeat protein